ncbi:MAG: penicillin-binding protein activator [Pseudomonadota bacterium]
MGPFGQSAFALKISVLLLLLTVLHGCGSAPGLPPGRVAFPDEQPAGEAMTETASDFIGQEQEALDPAAPPQFAAVEEALARHDWLTAKSALDALLAAMKPAALASDAAPLVDAQSFTRERIQSVGESTQASILDSPAFSKKTPALEEQAPKDQEILASDNLPYEDAGINAWFEYFNVLIHWERGRVDDYDRDRVRLASLPTPKAIRYRLALKELEVASLADDSERALAAIIELQRFSVLGNDPGKLSSMFWEHLQRLNEEELETARRALPQQQAWIDLALLSRIEHPQDVLANLETWIIQYGDHTALPLAEALRTATLEDASIERVAILAPISGPLERAGAAVSDGVFSEFYREQSSSQIPRRDRATTAASIVNMNILLIDTGRLERIEDAYGEAKAWEADLIVGPLEKRRVEQVFEFQPETPLITLNRRERSSADQVSDVLQLSLAPEDEASQLAEAAFADGLRRVVLLRPEGEWGDRMEGALVSRWNTLGGSVASAGVYGAMSSYSEVLRSTLNLDTSTERNRSVRRLFSSAVEVQDRRRKDLDGIFMICRNAEEARALKPLIDYHFAGDLPVYAVSTADTRSKDPNANRDLNGVRLLTMPWRVDGGDFEPPSGDLGSTLSPLFALGADAYRLSRRYHRSQASLLPFYSGQTAELRTTENGNLKRRLILAEFDRGVLRRR